MKRKSGNYQNYQRGFIILSLCLLLALALMPALAQEATQEPAPSEEAPTAESTAEPTAEPTDEPTSEPTVEPTLEPTTVPTVEPTTEPTVPPTAEPTAEPTSEPTAEPTAEATDEPIVDEPLEEESASIQSFAVAPLAASDDPSGDGIVPTTISGNQTCGTLGSGRNWNEFKIEPVVSGTYPVGAFSITITVYNTANGQVFDWTSTFGIDSVFAKGGNNGNLYLYDPPAEDFGDTGLHAPLNPNGQYAGLSHISFCYDSELTVTKDADESIDRTHDWDITKDPDANYIGFIGDSWTHNYTINAIKDLAEYSDVFRVSGDIWVYNGSPQNATVTGVTDVIDGIGSVAVSCGVTFPYTLPSGQTLHCTYGPVTLPDGSSRLNTATATTSGTVLGDSGTDTIDFTGAPVNDVTPPTSITDDYGTPGSGDDQSWGPFSSSASVGYSRDFSCPTDVNAYTNGRAQLQTVINTARLTVNSEQDTATVTVDCYIPSISKTASASYNENHEWNITKTVEPTEQHFFAGETAFYDWLVEVTENEYESDHLVAGQITVTNPNPEDALVVTISDALDDSTPGVISGCTGGTLVGDQLTVPASSTAVCDYTASPNDRTASSNTATITFGSFTFTDTESFLWVKTVVGPEEVTVDDDQNPDFPQTISSSQSFPYADSYTCSSNPDDYVDDGTYSFTDENLATLSDEDGVFDSDDAETTVHCYAPVVDKTAAGTYDEVHRWTIEKSVDPESQSAFAGDTVSYEWTVIVTETVTDENFAISGTISVHNPAPMTMTVTLADELDDGTPVVIEGCTGGTLVDDQLTILAGGTAECTYSAAPDDASAGLNTATATLNSIDFEAADPVEWTVNVIDPEVTVDDDQNPDFPQTITDGDTFTYSETYTCSSNTALYGDDLTYDFGEINLATVSNDEGVLDDDDAATTVHCYIPSIAKTAAGEYDERHEWDVEKSVDPESQSAFAGDEVDFDWTVEVTETVFEENFLVSGTITVTNPNPEDALVVTISDVLNDGTPGVISGCTGGTLVGDQLTVPAGGTAICDYTAAPDYDDVDDAPTANTASIILNSIAFSASDPIEWLANVIGATAHLTDDQKPLDETLSENFSDTYDDGDFCPTDTTLYDDNGLYSFTVTNTAVVTYEPDGYDESTAATTVYCYIPFIAKTAAGTYDEDHDWTIVKNVDPTAQSGFAGEDLPYTWEVIVSETVYEQNLLVSGTITVTNPNPEDALVVPLSDTLDDGTLASIDASSCTGGTLVGGILTVPAGGSATCSYSAVPASFVDTPDVVDPKPTLNTATITLNGIDFSDDDDIEWTPTVLDGSVVIHDPEVGLDNFETDSGGTWTGGETYTCSTDESAYGDDGFYTDFDTNLATLTDDDGLVLEDDAHTDFTCYAPLVSKTATTSFERTHEWDITKGPNGEYVGFAGDSFDHEYIIDVFSTGYFDHDWAVSGTITIVNPHPMEDLLVTSVEDLVSPDIDAAVVCPEPLVVPAGGFIECTYSTDLPNADQRTNTATVHIDYGTPASFSSAPVDVIFDDTPDVEHLTEVNVTDVNDQEGEQTFGPFGLPGGSANYTATYECPADEGQYIDGVYSFTVNNTATIDETSDSDSASVEVTCYLLEVTKDAETSLTRTWEWDITKTVTPSEWHLFTGDSGTSGWTVAVDKVGFVDSAWAVNGTIWVYNPASIDAIINSVSDVVSPDIAATVDCGVTFPYTLPAGETLECSYSADLPDDADRTNTATAALQNNDGGTTDFSGAADVSFDDAVITEVYASITVTDDRGPLNETTSDDASWTYPETFTCDEDEGTHSNTATIVETGQSASASVTVHCYALEVEKDANPTFTRDWDWDIVKLGDQTELTLQAGQTFIVNYEVTLTATSQDIDHAVSGTISVHNPAPIDALLNGVSDVVSPDIAAAVDCGVTFPHTLPAGETLECTYSADLPDGTDRTNTATATLQNQDYASDGSPTASGTTDFSFTANVDFGGPTEVLDECVDVTDDQAGFLGTVCQSESPKTFSYSLTVGPYTDCGTHEFVNVASFETSDQDGEDDDTGSDNHTIVVDVPCQGCTLTQGYWKTHSILGPAAHPDPTWYAADFDGDGTNEGPFETFFLSGQTWYQVFWTAPRGNVYYILARQYMAAKLNTLQAPPDGVNPPPNVAAALQWAETQFFNLYTPAQVGARSFSRTIRNQAQQYAALLDQFNNGLLPGIPHCDEDSSSANS